MWRCDEATLTVFLEQHFLKGLIPQLYYQSSLPTITIFYLLESIMVFYPLIITFNIVEVSSCSYFEYKINRSLTSLKVFEIKKTKIKTRRWYRETTKSTNSFILKTSEELQLYLGRFGNRI